MNLQYNLIESLLRACSKCATIIMSYLFLGIAPNTMLAKVCSDKNKPNGQYRVMPDRQEVMDFVKNLPIRKVQTLCLLHQITI